MMEFYRNLIYNNPILLLYMVSVAIDVFLGNITAWTTTHDVDSSVGLRGTIKHLGLMAFVMLFLPVLTLYLGTSTVSIGIVTYLVYQYAISIIENLSLMGFEMPPWLEDNLRRLKEKEEIDITESATVKVRVDKFRELREDGDNGQTTDDSQ